jgi:TatD DNase family protein
MTPEPGGDPAGALPGLTDTHCHLDHADYAADFPAVVDRAKAAGLARILIPGTDLASSRRGATLAAEDAILRFAAGVHPHDSESFDAGALAALEILARNGAVAIGEIGLDYYRDLSPRPRQREAFRAQLELALRLGLPVIVHIRDAWEDALAMLADCGKGLRGVLHAFSGDGALAERALALGLYLGAAGPVTYRKSDALREALKTCPQDKILLETDGPYLPPEGFRGKRNEPAYVAVTARRLAGIRGLEPSQLAALARANAAELFSWE